MSNYFLISLLALLFHATDLLSLQNNIREQTHPTQPMDTFDDEQVDDDEDMDDDFGEPKPSSSKKVSLPSPSQKNATAQPEIFSTPARGPNPAYDNSENLPPYPNTSPSSSQYEAPSPSSSEPYPTYDTSGSYIPTSDPLQYGEQMLQPDATTTQQPEKPYDAAEPPYSSQGYAPPPSFQPPYADQFPPAAAPYPETTPTPSYPNQPPYGPKSTLDQGNFSWNNLNLHSLVVDQEAQP